MVVVLLTIAYMLMRDWGFYERMAMMLSLIYGAVVFTAFAFYLYQAYEDKKHGEPFSDERTEATYNSRIAKAFLLTYWVVIPITWADFLMGRIFDRSQLPWTSRLYLFWCACSYFGWQA